MTLRIECPDCQQTFEVGEELKGKTVECGSCERQFKVSPEVVKPDQKRVFPDELKKKKADLSGFGRAPISNANAPVQFETAQYERNAHPEMIGRAPLIKTVATFAGIALLLLGLALLYLGARDRGGLLTDVGEIKRLVLAVFLGGSALFLLSWGMMKARAVGIVLGVVGAGGLIALALLMPVHRTVGLAGGEVPEETEEESDYIPLNERVAPGANDGSDRELGTDEVLEATRWTATVQPAIVEEPQGEVMGIWVRGMKEFYRLEIQNYLKDSLALPLDPDFRMLDDGAIFLATGVPLEMEEVRGVVSRFGEVEEVYPEMRLVQMALNEQVLGQTSPTVTAKLNDPEADEFYALNYEELRALSSQRVKAAVERLSLAEPEQMRTDITVRLVALLRENQNADIYGEIAEALSIWSQEGDGAGEVMAGIATEMRVDGKPIPSEILSFLAERKPGQAATTLVEVWAENPSTRQALLEEYGSGAATLLVPYLESDMPAQARSAASLLGRIGGPAQLPAMRETLQGAVDVEFRDILADSIARIENL